MLFFEKYRLEDAAFSTYADIPEEEIEKLEEKFDITLEKEHYMNVNEEDYNVRIFRANQKIDLYEVTDGADLSADDEILISRGYAKNNNVSIGDIFTIKGNDYRVAGFFLRPDYLYMLENTDDTYKNITTFFLAYMTDDAFEKLQSQSCEYKVIYSENTDVEQFRRDINDKYMLSSYLAKENNTRITMVDDQALMFLIMAYVFLVTIPLITVALISIIIGRKIKNEQKLIGTLSALGYTEKKLMWHYSVLAMIPGLIGGILITIVVKLIQQPYGELCLADYEPMPAVFSLPVPIAVVGALVPVLIYMLEAAHKVHRLLKKDTVAMLNGIADETRIRRVLADKPGKVRRKFAVRSILANPGRSFVVFLGSFLGALIILVAFMFIDSIEGVVDHGSESMGSFQYEYVLNKLETKKTEDADALVIGRYEYEGSSFSLIGAEQDVRLLNIETENGERADLKDGYYITNVMAFSYGLEAGDEFTFQNPMTMEETTVRVDGIIVNDSQKLLVCGADQAREILGWEDGTYNGLLSKEPLELGDEISKTITADDIREQMNTILDEMGAIIYALAVIGAIICIAALYVSVNMLVSENRRNISMLKVLGLRDREINRMVLDVNHAILPVGIAAGMLAGYGMMAAVFKIYSAMEGVLYSPMITVKSLLLTVLIVVGCYVISLVMVRKKANRVDMVESLKDNRE